MAIAQRLLAGLVAAAGVVASPLLASADPARDAYVQANFDVGMAKKFAEDCPGLAFDTNARRVRFLQLDQTLIGLGKNPSTYNLRLSDEDFRPANDAFAAKHGFSGQTDLAAFCAAAAGERAEGSAIGKMLKEAS